MRFAEGMAKGNFLNGYFKLQKAEVLNMSLTEFDQEAYDRHRFAEGMAEGARRTALKAARNFIRMGILPEQVAKGTELSLDEVLHLKEEIAADTLKNR